MKCPKCSYLGFDTGERCKNCGFDFSLMTVEEPAAELSLRVDADDQPGNDWRSQFDDALAGRPEGPPLQVSAPLHVSAGRPDDRTLHPAVEADLQVGRTATTSSASTSANAAAAALDFEPTLPPPSFRGAPALPLFGSSPAGEDEPLIKMPARPRAPLAVRRTPETPRLKAVMRPIERVAPEPALNFTEDPVAPAVPDPVKTFAQLRPPSVVGVSAESSPAGRRLLAATVDHGILLTIDAAVLYLTLRIAQLTMSEWTALALLPMGTFLGLLKLSYFTAFTCVGGQTIGKMAAGIRVVSDDHRPINATHAIHRALAGAVSFMTLGAGFLPALFGSDRRALHDRLAHTRVVTLPTP
jgi:uncharacterized RDD family membrane protein YckC